MDFDSPTMNAKHDVSTFAGRLEWAIERKKCNYSELARAMSVAPSVITQWRTGLTKSYEAVNIIKAARFLNVDVEWLVMGDVGHERCTMIGAELSEILNDLPAGPMQQTLDFISYQIDRAEGLLATEKATDYHKMIDKIIQDMKTKKGPL